MDRSDLRSQLIRLAVSEHHAARQAAALVDALGAQDLEPAGIPEPTDRVEGDGSMTLRPSAPEIEQSMTSVWGWGVVDHFKKVVANKDLSVHGWTNPVSGKWEGGNAVLNGHAFKPIGTNYGVSIKDCIIHPNFGPGWFDLKWGLRCFDVADWSVIDSHFRDIPGEHGMYLNVNGSVHWVSCLFFNIGSQAIQCVFRPNETLEPGLITAPGLLHVEKCIVKECGQWNGDRPAYALSFFPSGQDVLITGSVVETLNQPNWASGVPGYLSFGAIMAHEHPSVTIERTVVNYAKPNRDVVQLWNNKATVMRGVHVSEGIVEIRATNWEGKTVKVEGCRGGAKLRIAQGPLYQWPPAKILHEGPISAGFTL